MTHQELSVAAALAACLASYEASATETTETVVVRNAPKANDKATKGAKGAASTSTTASKGEINTNGSQASQNKAPGPKSEPLPAAGTIDAVQFLKGLAPCGKRPNANGVMVYQNADIKRDDEMRLVSSYCGWNPRELHGVQLENATRKARLTLKPVTGKEYKRGVSATMAGYIAGLPDHQQKLIQDLLAREQLAAKAIADHELTISNTQPTAQAHILAQGLLQLEVERLDQIRKDLATNGVL